MTWIVDANGNKCSVEYWSSREAAQNALDSLHDCINCTDCSDCSRCSSCSHCSDCSDLKDAKPVKAEEGSSYGPPLVPVIPDIHKKIYEAASRPEALEMDSFHTCKTTHCRAGWAVTLAGEEGKKLERFFNIELAAMMIYKASGYQINPCRFYDSNEDALEDMRKLAEGENNV